MIPSALSTTPSTPISGSSGIVSVYDPDPCFVLKGYEVWKDGRCISRFDPVEDSKASLEVEDAVYQQLGSHPNILGYGGRTTIADNTFSLKLERAKGDLRSLMATCPIPPEHTRLEMAIQIASGMSHIHYRGIFHCDFSCRNVFLFDDWIVKIGDFGGSKIGDRNPLGAEEVRYELPLRGRDWEERDYTKRDLFALGCAIHEIMAWKKPFAELADSQVEENYAREIFPDVDSQPAGEIIRRCWKEEFERAEDVEAALKEELGRVGVWGQDALGSAAGYLKYLKYLKGFIGWVFE